MQNALFSAPIHLFLPFGTRTIRWLYRQLLSNYKQTVIQRIRLIAIAIFCHFPLRMTATSASYEQRLREAEVKLCREGEIHDKKLSEKSTVIENLKAEVRLIAKLFVWVNLSLQLQLRARRYIRLIFYISSCRFQCLLKTQIMLLSKRRF